MPESPAPYEIALQVQPEDIDHLGHVNNIIYLRWVQEAATAHWNALTSPQTQAEVLWVVTRHEIDYKRSAMPGDGIIARTWVGPASRLLFERHTELLRASDRAILAKARTLWCPVDAQTQRPMSVSDEVRQVVSTGWA